MKPVNVLAPAEVELGEAVAWYRDRDPRVAQRFVDEARKALQLIETFPQIGARLREIDDAAVRVMPIHSFPYQVVFVELDARIDVVAFAHVRRHPRYFIKRIRRS